MSAVVYRTYDRTGRLLYVGSSTNVTRRMETHRPLSWWFGLVQQIVIEPHDDIKSARAAEATAIRAERPVANVAHTGRWWWDTSHIGADDLRFIRDWCDANPEFGTVRLPRALRSRLDREARLAT